jgi:hypothetical protein
MNCRLSGLGNRKCFSVNPANSPSGLSRWKSAYSLVETVAVLVITAMTMLATLTIYNRVRAATAAVNKVLDRDSLSMEILQRIAEDLDRLAFSSVGTTVSIQNKFDGSGYNLARLIIQNVVYGEDGKPRIFEKIIWQTSYDYFEDSLILYRSHNGINLEDKVITDDIQIEMKQENRDFLIPLCTGITFFRIQVPVVKVFGENAILPGLEGIVQVPEEEEKFLDRWDGNKLPGAVTVTISFAEPYQAVTGELDVLESDKVARTIAIDRTRNIRYRFVSRDLEPIDPNDLLEEDIDNTDTDTDRPTGDDEENDEDE